MRARTHTCHVASQKKKHYANTLNPNGILPAIALLRAILDFVISKYYFEQVAFSKRFCRCTAYARALVFADIGTTRIRV